jgi:hypothetical protein
MSQNELILEHLKKGRCIDPLTALNKWGIMRLASRCHDLRQMGYDILAVKKTVTNRFGDPATICIYRLMPKGK